MDDEANGLLDGMYTSSTHAVRWVHWWYDMCL